MENLTPAQQELYNWLLEYIKINRHAPSIRQMMRAMKLKSPAPIQSRLERLRNKGYIDWTEGKARTLRILKEDNSGIPILGAIAAGGLVETFTDVEDSLNLENWCDSSKYFALRVVGDSMVEDHITEGDLVVMQSLEDDEQLKEGEIVAARVEGHGTTLKRFYREGDYISLKASNPNYNPIRVPHDTVKIQGILVGVWRNYSSSN